MEISTYKISINGIHIHLCVHGGAKSFRLEQRGFNCDNFRIPDVRGVQICNKKIDPTLALDAFESSINVQLLALKLCEKTKSDEFVESKDGHVDLATRTA